MLFIFYFLGPNMTFLMFIWKIDRFKIVFLKYDFFAWKSSLWKTTFDSLFIYNLFKIFWNLKKHLKVFFCKDDCYINFFEITRENCLYKRWLLSKFFWNLKKHMKDNFLKKAIRNRLSQRRLSRKKSSLRKTILNQSIF